MGSVVPPRALFGCLVMAFGVAILAESLPAQASGGGCSSPAGVAGDQIYSSTVNMMQFCNGNSWVNMGAASGAFTSGTVTPNNFCTANASGTAIVCGMATVSLTNQASGTLQAAQFPALTGDVTTTAGSLATAVKQINGVALGPTTATTGNLLVADGSKWNSVALSGPIAITSAGVTSMAVNSIPRISMAQGIARSVVGVAGNATANVADIQGTANQVLTVNAAGTALGFGTVNLSSSAAVSGNIQAVNLPSGGTASNYLKGDGTWGTPAAALGGLSDVTVTSPADKQVLSYNFASSKWVNANPSGGTLATLTDVAVPSPTNNQILAYNTGSSKWVNTSITSALTAAVAPSMSVYLNAASQPVTANTGTKINFDTVLFDTNSNWSAVNHRYTPTVAGQYLVIVNVQIISTGAGDSASSQIYKNGSLVAQSDVVAALAGQGVYPNNSAIVSMNGTTDYLEAYVYTNKASIVGGASVTYMTAGLLAPLASGTVAGTGTSGYIPVWTSGNAQTNSVLFQSGSNVGIGTASPGFPLHVLNTSGAIVRVESPSTAPPRYSWNMSSGGADQKKWQFYASTNALSLTALNDAENAESLAMHILRGTGTAISSVNFPSGNVGIGTISPTYTLEVWGNQGSNDGVIKIRNTGAPAGSYWKMGPDTGNNMIVYNSSNAGVYMTNGGTSWVANSDIRLKKNITTYSVLDKLADYRAVAFDWKSSNRHELGVIAQELYRVFPELVIKGDDDPNRKVAMGDKKAWSVTYDRLGALSMQGVKELKSLFDSDHDMLVKLKAANDNQAAQIKALSAANAQETQEVENNRAMNAATVAQVRMLQQRLDRFEAARAGGKP